MHMTDHPDKAEMDRRHVAGEWDPFTDEWDPFTANDPYNNDADADPDCTCSNGTDPTCDVHGGPDVSRETPAPPTETCGIRDGGSGTCNLPKGHETRWHQETRDGEIWAQWSDGRSLPPARCTCDHREPDLVCPTHGYAGQLPAPPTVTKGRIIRGAKHGGPA
jgi:hypothetical protein